MKVSVVIPTHNRHEMLVKALDSVVLQTYNDLEIIVVSDGSTDETDTVINEYKSKDSRIHYISYHPNRGGNYARNIGIKNASGDYIAFLDDDDEWLPQKIELQMKEFIENPKVGLVYTGVNIIYDDLKVSYSSIPQKTGDLSKDMLITNCIGTTSSVMVSAKILKKTGLFDEKLKARQDYDLWLRVCQETEVGAVSLPLLNYHNFDSVDQISDDTEKYADSIKYINEKYNHLYSKMSDKKKLMHKQANYLLLIKRNMRNNNPKAARYYLRKHFKTKPSIQAIVLYLGTRIKYKTIIKLKGIKNR